MRRALLVALALAATTAHAAEPTLFVARDPATVTTCIVLEKRQDNARVWPSYHCTKTYALQSPALDVELVGGKYRVTVKDARRVRVTMED